LPGRASRDSGDSIPTPCCRAAAHHVPLWGDAVASMSVRSFGSSERPCSGRPPTGGVRRRSLRGPRGDATVRVRAGQKTQFPATAAAESKRFSQPTACRTGVRPRPRKSPAARQHHLAGHSLAPPVTSTAATVRTPQPGTASTRTGPWRKAPAHPVPGGTRGACRGRPGPVRTACRPSACGPRPPRSTAGRPRTAPRWAPPEKVSARGRPPPATRPRDQRPPWHR
jgi:hypothetical protein